MRALVLCLAATLFAAGQKEPTPRLIVEKKYAADPQVAWEAVVRAVGEVGGEVRFSDADSGLVFYVHQDPGEKAKTYINVYVDTVEGQAGAWVYFVAHTWDGRSLEPVEAQFFARLDGRLKEVGDSAIPR